VEDLLLALETDIFGPFDHARQVSSGLDILADTEVSGALLDERVLIHGEQACAASHGRRRSLTFGVFFEPAFPCGKGAGATFLPAFGGCH